MKLKVNTKAKLSNEITELETKNAVISYKAALEGIVLLENDGALPVKPGKLALFGAGADYTIKGGTGSGEVMEREVISIYEGLMDAGYEITTKAWIDRFDTEYREGKQQYIDDFRKGLFKHGVKDMVNIMSFSYQFPAGPDITAEDLEGADTDTCIYVISRQAGEGIDRKLDETDYILSDREKENIRKCAESFEKFILVINTGAAIDLSFKHEIPGINAIIYFCEQGMMGGKAFASIVSGETSPSGKLTATWAKTYDDIPFGKEYSYLNGNTDEEYYKEDIFVGYRYFDTFRVEPEYRFGYGLSYTTFDIGFAGITNDKSKITLKFIVKNAGDEYAGKEVVQAYIDAPKGEGLVSKEAKKLVGYAKTKLLKPGESEEVEITFDMKDQAYYDTSSHSYKLDKGLYRIKAGNSSEAITIVSINLTDDIRTSLNIPICGAIESIDEMLVSDGEINGEEIQLEYAALMNGVSDLQLTKDDFSEERYKYITHSINADPTVQSIMENLSIKDMATLTVGAGMTSSPKFFTAPGSAGNTTSALLKKGIPNVCLADGPAGLRLQRQSVAMGNGKLKGTEPMISVFEYFPDIIRNRMVADPSKGTVLYQYVTSFPVGMALAQTWNEELLYKVGDAVGKEMAEYGVTYWLAPGMNIQRNPLCGRNFEYYSEDPLVAGKCAAAITRGVQSNKGCYVTLKHFCCNNHEDNRNFTNSNVTERALREIYLKAFEIAVKESNPGAIMSSYNKVNGTYVNNSYDLLTKVLRNEWGFSGLVMTDWLATADDKGDHAKALAAGNDLIMPGSKEAIETILEGLETDIVQREDIRRCASNVLYGIVSSRIYNGYKKMKDKMK